MFGGSLKNKQVGGVWIKRTPQISFVIYLIFIEFNILMSKEKDQNDKFLRFGQGILIQGYNPGSEGVLTAKGFADIRALFETYDDILYFKNYRNSIFQILPASSFDIHDELKHIRLYLDIEKVRFEDKFEYIEEIPENILDSSVPNMIFQPLFENAIKHGVYESLEKVTLKLTAT